MGIVFGSMPSSSNFVESVDPGAVFFRHAVRDVRVAVCHGELDLRLRMTKLQVVAGRAHERLLCFIPGAVVIADVEPGFPAAGVASIVFTWMKPSRISVCSGVSA